jgi:hypothetical protein
MKHVQSATGDNCYPIYLLVEVRGARQTTREVQQSPYCTVAATVAKHASWFKTARGATQYKKKKTDPRQYRGQNALHCFFQLKLVTK